MEKLELFGVLIAAAWAFFKACGFVEMRRMSKMERLYNALEVGVHQAWKKVVKPWLKRNPSEKKLPPDIRKNAEEHAIRAAGNIDRITLKFPNSVIHATLAAAVEEAKRLGGK